MTAFIKVDDKGDTSRTIESNSSLVPDPSHVHHQAREKQNETKDERPTTNKISQGIQLIVFRNNDIFLCQYIPNHLENLFMRFESHSPDAPQFLPSWVMCFA
jgi:hypothetical protein